MLLVVGRLTAAKGLRELLAAWATVEPASGAATLVLAGAGPLRAELDAEVRRRGLQRVRLVGAVPHGALAEVYAAGDVLVMPTLEDNWSLVVPEAMACGLPVLCSRYNGCHPELVQPGRNGWVFDPCDAAGAVAALREVLAAAPRWPALGAASEDLVAAHTPARAADSLLHACRLALERR